MAKLSLSLGVKLYFISEFVQAAPPSVILFMKRHPKPAGIRFISAVMQRCQVTQQMQETPSEMIRYGLVIVVVVSLVWACFLDSRAQRLVITPAFDLPLLVLIYSPHSEYFAVMLMGPPSTH